MSTNTITEETPRVKQRKGFACMDRERVSAIASLGGKEAHRQGKAHVFSHEEAQEAGKRGGSLSRRDRSLTEAERRAVLERLEAEG